MGPTPALHVSEDLSWTTNTTSLAKKSQWCTIESILTGCITVWYGSCTASIRKTLQRTVKDAGWVIGVPLTSLLDIYGTRLTRRATGFVGDRSLLPWGDGTAASRPAPLDWETAFSTRLSGSSTLSPLSLRPQELWTLDFILCVLFCFELSFFLAHILGSDNKADFDNWFRANISCTMMELSVTNHMQKEIWCGFIIPQSTV